MNVFYKFLITAFSLSIFSEGILLPIYAIFVQEVGGDILEASTAMAIFLITEGIITILIHRIKWNKKQQLFLLVLGWAIWTLGIISYLFVSSIAMLFVTQILTAIGNAIADPIFDTELSAHIDKNKKEFEWGFFEGLNSFIQGVAALLGGMIAYYFGFSWLIYTMIGAAGVSFFLIIFYLPLLRKNSQNELSS